MEAAGGTEEPADDQPIRRNIYGLTFRELQVLRLAANGSSDREIAIALGISHLTAQKHMSNALAKLGVTSRTGAVAKVLREGILV